MNKTIIFDFDDVIAKTKHGVCRYYNNQYSHLEGFVNSNGDLVKDWNFSPCCGLMTSLEIKEVFCNEYMFDYIEPMEGIYQVLRYLKDKGYIMKLYTIGKAENLILKLEWLEEWNLKEYFNDIILKDNSNNHMDDVVMDKSDFNMEDAIFIDDHQNNLLTCSAKYPICFAPTETNYNNDWNGLKAKSMKELLCLIQLLEEKGEI